MIRSSCRTAALVPPASGRLAVSVLVVALASAGCDRAGDGGVAAGATGDDGDAIALAAASVAPAPVVAPPVRVAVGVAPHAWLVHRLAGDAVEVVLALPPHASCHDHAPAERHVVDLGRTRLFLGSGVAAERAAWLTTVLDRQDVPTVDLLAAAGPANVADPAAAADPHAWTSPTGLRRQAAAVAEALAELLPDHAARIGAAATELDAELAALETEVATILAPAAGRTIVVDHPAWTRLAADHRLVQLAVEPEPGLVRDHHLQLVRRTMQRDGIDRIFVQPQHPGRSSAAVALTVGAELVSLDPMSDDPVAAIRAAARAFAGDPA